MLVRFTKMHGLGNDFVVLDLVTQRVKINERVVKKLANRNTGIGFDQLLIVEPPSQPDMDFSYRIFNADGSEVEHCGNGARCFAKFVRDKNLVHRDQIRVETAKGQAILNLRDDRQVEVNMGPPMLTPAEVPFQAETEADSYSIEVDGQQYTIGVVSMGNPHGVLIVDDIDTTPVEVLGPALESHPRFPARANIGFMQILSRNEVKLRVYERGAGETLACGTGACGAMVAGRLQGLLDETVTLHLRGGDLEISWAGKGAPVIMTGPATTVFEGQIFL